MQVKVGVVTEYSQGKVSIQFPDYSNMIVKNVPVAYPNSYGMRVYWPLEAGQQVMHIITDDGFEYCQTLMVYDTSTDTNSNIPFSGDANTHGVIFEDGTEVIYNKSLGTYKIESAGSVTINSDSGSSVILGNGTATAVNYEGLDTAVLAMLALIEPVATGATAAWNGAKAAAKSNKIKISNSTDT